MTPTTLDMTRTKSLIESDLRERTVWDGGGYWIESKDPTLAYGDDACSVFTTQAAAVASEHLSDEETTPRLVTISEALLEARSDGYTSLLLLDETMTVVESWPVR